MELSGWEPIKQTEQSQGLESNRQCAKHHKVHSTSDYHTIASPEKDIEIMIGAY